MFAFTQHIRLTMLNPSALPNSTYWLTTSAIYRKTIRMVMTHNQNTADVFARLSEAAINQQQGMPKGECKVSCDDLTHLLMSYTLELGNQGKQLPEPSGHSSEHPTSQFDAPVEPC